MSDPVRVLHVDDEPDLTALTATFLEREDERFTLETAASASEGLDRLADGDYDCIVSDYDMPDANGVEFLETVREDRPDLPFILFTGKGSEAVAGEAISAGVTDYLQKGTGTEQYELLANRIDNVVAQRRAERRAAERERTLSLRREVSQALVRASTRADIEARVTDILASAEPYRLAWIGEYDSEHRRVVPRAVAGVDEGSVAPTSLRGMPADDGAVFEAVRTQSPAVAERGDPTLDVWTDESRPVAYEAAVALPVVYRGERHGLLAVYAAEADRVDAAERSMLGEIAGDVARSVHAAETRRTLERHRTAVEAVPEGVFVLDDSATVTLLNESAAALVDRTPAEVRGEPFSTFIESGIFDEAISEWYVESVREMLSSANDREDAWYETEIRPPNGDARTVEVHLTLRPYDEEYNGTVGVVRDVTHRKRREREIRRNERRFEAVFENPMTLIALVAPDGTLLEVNRTAAELVETSADEVTGEAFWETPWWTHSEALQDRLRTWVERAADGEHVRFEADHPAPDGGTAAVDGLIYPVRRADGTITELLAVGRDVTERRRRERELERQNERLEEFAGVVSHDLRNPLSVSEGRLELARAECDSEHLADVARAHDRMAALIDDLLTLARDGDPAGSFEPIPLADVAEECWRNVETDAAALVTDTDRTVRADRGRLRRLLENLFRNAVEHGDEGVTVTVGDLDDAGFYVADDGPGIPADERDDAFRTGRTGTEDGTGFGLSIVRRIAEAHGWEVDLTESGDGGARFEVSGAT